ncbi:hypothetical protein [Daejeonella oryzae]|uniref:hypothetical protein n=1 Tax=Daejeonella oryzae TaxID=1122943 RepID=UPI00047E5FE4|nr:hypothetical protein [Daejeonella oryzae]
MRKLLLAFGILTALFLSGVYLFIPDTIYVQQNIIVKASDFNSLKYLSSAKGWQKWWPEKGSAKSGRNNMAEYCFDSVCYNLIKTTNSGAQILLKTKNIHSKANLNYIGTSTDSMNISLVTDFPAGRFPLERISNYQKGTLISKNFKVILEQIKTFFDHENRVYGITIKQERVKHMILLTMVKISPVYPDVNFVYQMVTDLRKILESGNVPATASPMLSVHKPYKKDFEITVAIPTSKEIPSTNNASITKMVEGKLLVTEVKGGPQTIKNAFNSFQQYVKDNRLISPAMPYEMMITDRKAIKDTSKWITQIYYPVL